MIKNMSTQVKDVIEEESKEGEENDLNPFELVSNEEREEYKSVVNDI